MDSLLNITYVQLVDDIMLIRLVNKNMESILEIFIRLTCCRAMLSNLVACNTIDFLNLN
jgi:hypothetical protein